MCKITSTIYYCCLLCKKSIIYITILLICLLNSERSISYFRLPTLSFNWYWLQIQHKELKSIILCVVYKPPNFPVSCFVDDFMDNYTAT